MSDLNINMQGTEYKRAEQQPVKTTGSSNSLKQEQPDDTALGTLPPQVKADANATVNSTNINSTGQIGTTEVVTQKKERVNALNNQ